MKNERWRKFKNEEEVIEIFAVPKKTVGGWTGLFMEMVIFRFL